jgi:diphthamide biosynthesis protein 7
MTTISSLRSHTLVDPPSCIAFCPSQPEYFVVGTYFLHPKASDDSQDDDNDQGIKNEDDAPISSGPQKRDGRLIVHRVSDDDEMCVHTIVGSRYSKKPVSDT